MASDLVLYTNPMSRGRTARWMLEEVGAPYEAVVLDYASSMKGLEYLAINPMGKVPAIVHRGKVVTEVAAICAYLADAFPEAGLAPPPAERADYYRWLFFAAGPVEQAFTNKSLGVTPTDQQKRMVGYGCFEQTIDALEAAVSATHYVTGDTFTAADVYVGAQIGFMLQFGMLEPRPAFVAYWNRVSARDAFKRAAAVDDALIAAAQEATAEG
ncbi:glutathione S-transferase [Sphingomonas panacis]|uniref:Glutathione S-transferase n=1 Tax=Sphingomonas panacis TaxID=1560345 RepID=A0A1B3ZGU1_9SPHN|nr:glutathione S-transferase family protein [Sphingomonas panacis]AOH86648.1 glutathione S-transferase [Sphingomonas panacis]